MNAIKESSGMECSARGNPSKSTVNILELQNYRKRKLAEYVSLGKEILILDQEILMAKRSRTLKKLEMTPFRNYIESPERVAKLLDVVTKVANGEITNGSAVIGLMKKCMEEESAALPTSSDKPTGSAEGHVFKRSTKILKKGLVTGDHDDLIGEAAPPIEDINDKGRESDLTKEMGNLDDVSTAIVNSGGPTTDQNLNASWKEPELENYFLKLPPEMVDKIFSLLDQKHLMPLRQVCIDWKREVDVRLVKKNLEIWLPVKTDSRNFSATGIMDTFSRETAVFRVCCTVDMEEFLKSLEFDTVDPEQVIIPSKSLMIGTARKDASELVRKRYCGRHCQITHGGFFQLDSLVNPNAMIVVDFLRRVGQNLNVVVLSNLYVSSDNSPGSIMRYFKQILETLQTVRVIVLKNAFASTKRKAMRNDGRPMFIKKSEPRLSFPNLEKLVVSEGSMDVVEYTFFQTGPFLKELVIVDPFKYHHFSENCLLLTPLRNQIHRLENLNKLSLEIRRIDLPNREKWKDIVSILEKNLPQLTSLNVVILDNHSVYVPNVVGLASKFPALTELRIYVDNHNIASNLVFLANIIRVEKKGLINLKRLCLGTNMLQSESLTGLLNLVHLMENLEIIEFHDIGYFTFFDDPMRLRYLCGQFHLFDKLPRLRLIKATLKERTIKIWKG